MNHEKVRRKVRALWSLRAEVKKRLSGTGIVEVNLTEQESRLSEMADLRVAGKGELRRRKKKTLKVSENVENAASSQALVSGVPPSSLVDDSTPASPADPFADSAGEVLGSDDEGLTIGQRVLRESSSAL